MSKLTNEPTRKKYFKMATSSKELIEWDPKFNLGVAEIDQQHRDIVTLANEIQTSISTKSRKAGFVLEVMEKLDGYMVEHFSYEEGLMQDCSYPGLEGQKKEHASFMKYVKELQDQYKTSIIDLKQVFRFISYWFVDHIQGSDKSFFEWKSKL